MYVDTLRPSNLALKSNRLIRKNYLQCSTYSSTKALINIYVLYPPSLTSRRDSYPKTLVLKWLIETGASQNFVLLPTNVLSERVKTP